MIRISLKVKNGVDQMLQHPRSGDCSILCDVAGKKDGHPRGFSERLKAGGTFPYLRDRACSGWDIGRVDGLDRIDDR